MVFFDQDQSVGLDLTVLRHQAPIDIVQNQAVILGETLPQGFFVTLSTSVSMGTAISRITDRILQIGTFTNPMLGRAVGKLLVQAEQVGLSTIRTIDKLLARTVSTQPGLTVRDTVALILAVTVSSQPAVLLGRFLTLSVIAETLAGGWSYIRSGAADRTLALMQDFRDYLVGLPSVKQAKIIQDILSFMIAEFPSGSQPLDSTQPARINGLTLNRLSHRGSGLTNSVRTELVGMITIAVDFLQEATSRSETHTAAMILKRMLDELRFGSPAWNATFFADRAYQKGFALFIAAMNRIGHKLRQLG